MKFEVVAPSDLECGYPLEVEINGKPLVVPVPNNVKAGEIIQSKWPRESQVRKIQIVAESSSQSLFYTGS